MDHQKEQTSQVPNSFPATIGKKLNPNAAEFIPSTSSSSTGKKLNPNAPEFIPRTSSSTATQPPPLSTLKTEHVEKSEYLLSPRRLDDEAAMAANRPETRTTGNVVTPITETSKERLTKKAGKLSRLSESGRRRLKNGADEQTISGPSLPCCRFAHDIFEDVLPAPYYYTCTRPMKMEVVLCWPHSVDGVNLAGVEPKFYIHGIFSEDKAVWFSKSDYANLEFRNKAEQLYGRLWEVDRIFQDYKDEILMYWPSLKDSESLEAAKLFFLYEWRKHGLRTGMSAHMYLFYALAIRDAIAHDFGISIGVPIPLEEALDCIRRVMGKLMLFGEPIGAEVNPEIHIGIGMIDNAHTINDIRLLFSRSINNRRKAQFEYNGAKPKKEFPKATIDEHTLVILPSKDQMKQLLAIAKSGGVSLKEKFVVV